MEIVPLSWDSMFFNLRIARLNVDEQDEVGEVLAFAESQRGLYDLIYIFCPENYFLPEHAMEHCTLVDQKVIYAGKVDGCSFQKDSIHIYDSDIPNEDLYELAKVSAMYSRFKTDLHLGPDAYVRLYNRWIENSVNRQMADVVMCYYDNSYIVGMVTAKEKDDTAVIGLVAVAQQMQSQGIGSNLMRALQKWAFDNEIQQWEVATQLQNEKACTFYEKLNMKKRSVTNIYHYWLVY
ncbi:MAG TPA: GNAT family N-acetyltransferase [Paludibacteraceae bacterium]|nr:GNAT family N-acetyltransferase [Paludibacteraceae bacterium]